MKTANITNDFGNTVVNTYEEAVKVGTQDFGFNEEEILERNNETVTLEIDGKIQEVELNAIYVDSGSEDYIYFFNY